jgi:hypothetical protein
MPRMIRLLAIYNLIYIIFSMQFHTALIFRRGTYNPEEIFWVLLKLPVLMFCILVLMHRPASK